MGLLSASSSGSERLVDGAFAKAFKAEVQPVEIAAALQREMRRPARPSSAAAGSLAPNDFDVELVRRTTSSGSRRTPRPSASELAGMVAEHAEEQRYSFAGAGTGRLRAATTTWTPAIFRVRSEARAGVGREPGVAAARGAARRRRAPAARRSPASRTR